jgi:HSP20 family protein
MLLKKFEHKSPLDLFFNDSLFDDYIPKTTNVPFDIIESENEYEINLALAGYNKDDFNLEVEDGKLIISGERVERENAKYNIKNSYYGKFTKSFTLPKEILIDKIDAEYVNGVLNVKVPKDKELISSKTIVVR